MLAKIEKIVDRMSKAQGLMPTPKVAPPKIPVYKPTESKLEANLNSEPVKILNQKRTHL